MAPLKRRHRDYENEVIDVASASSSLRQDAQRKKARVSVSQVSSKTRHVRNETPSSEESDEDEEMAEPQSDHAPACTQYEMFRDNNFEHLQQPDLDDEQTQRKFLARRKLIGENHAADNAIIEEITCINFMCHERLHVPLGPLINFVVGMNGSGKSAVLTAITLCLGGKASATNRGASLKSLIKGGTENAVLRVKLKNQGADAYQPDIYGDSIIIERHFSKTGSSGYRLKSSTDRTISTKKGDVDDIIEYFNLQVDNPMNVLTQDAAKSFISTSTPKQKYQFFIEGVQLQQLDNDYKLLSDLCDQIESKANELKTDVKDLGKRQEEAKAKKDIVDQHATIRQQARMIANQLAWAQVEEVEKSCRQQEAVIAEVQSKLERAEAVAEEKGETYERTNAATERAQELAIQLQQDINPLQDKAETAKAAHDQMTTDVYEFHHQERGIVDSMKEAKKRIAASLNDIANEEKRIEDMNGGAPGRKQAEITKAEQKVAEAREAQRNHESNRSRLEDESRGADLKLLHLEEELNQKSTEVANCQKRLDALNKDRGNHMAGFHPRMAELLLRIQKNQSFIKKPIGPIGSHIKLLEPKWSMLVESIFGNVLTGFIVASKPDQVQLSKILRELKMDFCPIYIGNGQAINTANHEPHPQYNTILRVLEIDNELVKRQLIINQRIEQTILVPTRQQGLEIMFRGPRPQNVYQCYTFQSNNNYGLRQAFTPNGNQDSSPIKLLLNQLPRMRTDSESQISGQREQSAQLSNEKSKLETKKRELQQAKTKCRQALEQHKRAHSALRIDIQKAEELVDKLRAEFDQVNVEDGRLEDYKLQLADAQRDKEMYELTYGNHGLERDKLNEKALSIKRDYDAAKKRIEDHEQMIKKAQAKFRNAQHARQIAVEEKNVAVDTIDGLKTSKAKEESRLQRRKEHLETFITGASEVCPRVPIGNGETAASLDTQLKSYQRRLDGYSKRLGADDNAIYNAFEQATKRYDDAARSYNDTSELLQLLKQTFRSRIHMFRRFQRYISSRSRINFKYLLSERAFRGKLLIDHQNKLLDVHVEPDETTKNGKGRQTKTLSGGEKSFSSICLLLALWEAMGAPLRCLDEFDVFMDEVNRDVSTKMIISAARKSVGRQFILITPKALGAGVDASDDVQIHKLKDPRERGQQTLDHMVEE